MSLYDDFIYVGASDRLFWWTNVLNLDDLKASNPAAVAHDGHGNYYGVTNTLHIGHFHSWEEAVCFAAYIDIEVPEELLSDINILED